MSGWRSGKINIKCSIEILQDVLQKVMPKWKDRISIDKYGQLELKDVNSTKCHVLVDRCKRGSNFDKSDNYHPIGFVKNDDDTWTIHSMDFYNSSQLENQIKTELAIRKIKLEAKNRNAKIITSQDSNGQKRIKMHVPVGPKYQMLA